MRKFGVSTKNPTTVGRSCVTEPICRSFNLSIPQNDYADFQFHLSDSAVTNYLNLPNISLYDILRATEGDFKKVEMLIEGKSRSDSIIMEEVWQGAFQELLNYFSNVSLQECLEKYVKHMDKEPIMFNI